MKASDRAALLDNLAALRVLVDHLPMGKTGEAVNLINRMEYALKPTTTAYALPATCVLWGSHPDYADGAVIRLHAGTQRQCQTAQDQRKRDGGWIALGIYRAGDEPTGLRMQVEAR